MNDFETPKGARLMQCADSLVTKNEGPWAVGRVCRICGHHLIRRRGIGRGAGMREGNKQRGEMYQHIKADHPGALALVFETFNAVDADGNRGGWKAVDALPISDLKKVDERGETQ